MQTKTDLMAVSAGQGASIHLSPSRSSTTLCGRARHHAGLLGWLVINGCHQCIHRAHEEGYTHAIEYVGERIEIPKIRWPHAAFFTASPW